MKLAKNDYQHFLRSLKQEIIAARQKVYRTANRHLVELYWLIGKGMLKKIELSY